jgi:hypothetical protein
MRLPDARAWRKPSAEGPIGYADVPEHVSRTSIPLGPGNIPDILNVFHPHFTAEESRCSNIAEQVEKLNSTHHFWV